MRWIVAGIAALYVAVAVILVVLGLGGWFVLWSLFQACFLVGTLVFERWRYRPHVDSSRGRWQPTGERFVDPATGRVTEVMYNPDTGQRDYVEVRRNGN